MHRPTAEGSGENSPQALSARIVRYPHRSDRVTIHPTGVDEVTLMGSWLTADATDLVALDSVE